MSLLGFEDEELARLLAAQDAVEGRTDEDAVPELPETPTSRVGDLWVLGEHKLLVGDATNHTDVVRLMAGDVADPLIACERRGRRARLMEIDPKYADCIACRFQDYSGKSAVLDADGHSFDAIAQERSKESV